VSTSPHTTPDPAALQRDLRSDFVLRMMVERGVPLTRENYLAFAYPGNLPDPWTVEHELEMPEILRCPELG
jgi:hypothetical protein